MLTPDQKATLAQLTDAFRVATECGLLDEMQGHCRNPDAINDVIDAAAYQATELATFLKRHGAR